MWKRLLEWLKLVLALREPTAHERVQEARHCARVLRQFDSRLARELEVQADKLEAELDVGK